MGRERALKVVLILGLIFLLAVYPLMMFLWPSGWRWQPNPRRMRGTRSKPTKRVRDGLLIVAKSCVQERFDPLEQAHRLRPGFGLLCVWN